MALLGDVALHDLFSPTRSQLSRGDTVSVVVDGVVFTNELVLGQVIPDGRIFGEVNCQVKGCRGLSVIGALVDFSLPFVDLLLTDSSMVVAHGLGPVAEIFRLVEVCAGVACSSVGLSEPLARLHQQLAVQWSVA